MYTTPFSAISPTVADAPARMPTTLRKASNACLDSETIPMSSAQKLPSMAAFWRRKSDGIFW